MNKKLPVAGYRQLATANHIMKKTLLAVITVLAAGTLTAAQLVEAIVIRVGDRIVTRTQYDKRLHDAIAEAEQTVPPAQLAAKKDEIRKNLPNSACRTRRSRMRSLA